MVFPVVMYRCELDHKEGCMTKNWCFWTVMLEKTLESLLDRKKIKPVNPKGNQSWILIGRTDAEAETPILWPPDAKGDLFIGKRPWCLERLRAGGERGGRGWDGWMVSLIQWSWTWANSWRWWGTGKPVMLQSMGLQRVGHKLATEQQQQQFLLLSRNMCHKENRVEAGLDENFLRIQILPKE